MTTRRRAVSCSCLMLELLPLALAFCCAPVRAQATVEPGFDYIPGRPWTAWIPDPDRYPWANRTSRPGYRRRPMTAYQELFYQTVMRKRRQGIELNWAENMMIRRMQALRCWPEAPRPNAFWRAFMRYMRNQTTDELNSAQSLMLTEMMARGLIPQDMPTPPGMQNMIDYLRTGPFEPRGIFDYYFGRLEPFVDYQLAAAGFDMNPKGTPGNVFPPGGAFNGMQITYNVSGATLGKVTDAGGMGITRTVEGTLQPGTLRVSGRVSVGGYGADLVARVWAGSKEQKLECYIKNEGANSGKAFDLSVPVPQGTQTGGFSIRLDGHYSMGGGWRGCYVTGNLAWSTAEKAAAMSAEDAKWRDEVEKTLKTLGYADTPDGREVKEMRDASKAGGAAWKAFVDRHLQKLGYDKSPEAAEYFALKAAMDGGGQQWQDYARGHGGDTSGGTDSVADPNRPDVGGLTVGVLAEEGKVIGPTTTFDRTSRVSTATQYANIPEGTPANAIWERDGKEIMRGQRQVGGTGWASFSLLGKDGADLTPGKYTLTIVIGGQVTGRKTFVIGGGGAAAMTSAPSPPPTTTPPATTGTPPTPLMKATGNTSSTALPTNPYLATGAIRFKLLYTKPGVIVDTAGIGVARPGDYCCRVDGDGTLAWQIYHPEVSGPKRLSNGWHVLTTTSVKLAANTWYDLALGYGGRGMTIVVNGAIAGRCDTVLALSDSKAYFGDTPADAAFSSYAASHGAFTGEVKELRFTP